MAGPIQLEGRRYDKVHVIQHVDRGAGFCAFMTYALNGVRIALNDNALPVVNFDNRIRNFFYEASRGENVWDYYFEPVMGWSYEDLEQKLAEGEVSKGQVHSYTDRQSLDWHHSDPDRLATFWAHHAPPDRRSWVEDKRRLGREYVGRFIKVKSHILAKVDEFAAAEMSSRYVIGVHIRGTDFAYAEPTSPSAYFAAIRCHIAQQSLREYAVFLATDQQQFVDAFRAEFGSRLLTSSSRRSDNDMPVFRLGGMNPYQKGEEALIDVLLLSKCAFLFKCAAAGGEYALWFNPSLRCHDFGLGSEYDPKPWNDLDGAYWKLGVGEEGGLRRFFVGTFGAKALHLLGVPRIRGFAHRVLHPLRRHRRL